MNLRGLTTYLMLTLGTVLTAFAQAGTESMTQSQPQTQEVPGSGKLESVELRVYFKQGKSRLEPSFRDNEERLRKFVSQVSSHIADSAYVIKDIVITSGASPEGKVLENMELSLNRGLAIQHYMESALNLPESIFRINALGEDWEGLRDLVMKYDFPRSDKVLEIIDSNPKDRKKRLMDLDGGRVWNYMLETIFPELRSGNNNVVCHIVRREDVQPARPVPYDGNMQPHRVDTVVIMQPVVDENAIPDFDEWKKTSKKNKPYYFAIKTNALYDLLLTPNVEVEFPIGRKFSIMAEHWFPWYFIYNNRYAWEVLYSGAELRWWFTRKTDHRGGGDPYDTHSVLTGWFLAPYGGVGKYDVQYNGPGRQGELYSAGLTIGGSFYLGRRWRLECSLSAGYMHTDYRLYQHNQNVDLLIYDRSDAFNWYGPTKAKVSFSYIIGGKSRKGGNK